MVTSNGLKMQEIDDSTVLSTDEKIMDFERSNLKRAPSKELHPKAR